MAEIIAESKLSAGAVYLYFRSKEDLIAATAATALGMARDLIGQLAAAAEPSPPDRVLDGLLARLTRLNDESGGLLFPVAVEAWSEASRNPSIAETARAFIETILSELAAVYRRWEGAGHSLAIPAEDLARLSVAVLQGTIVQMTGFGLDNQPSYRASLSMVFSVVSDRVMPGRPE